MFQHILWLGHDSWLTVGVLLCALQVMHSSKLPHCYISGRRRPKKQCHLHFHSVYFCFSYNLQKVYMRYMQRENAVKLKEPRNLHS